MTNIRKSEWLFRIKYWSQAKGLFPFKILVPEMRELLLRWKALFFKILKWIGVYPLENSCGGAVVYS